MGVNKGIYPSLGQEPPPTPASGGQVTALNYALLWSERVCPPLEGEAKFYGSKFCRGRMCRPELG